MTLDQVRTFLEIARTGSFQSAAETLNVTQSTVSARVKGLEDALGQVLFLRSRTGVQLTYAGQQFHRYGVVMNRAWSNARSEVDLPDGYRTTLGIAVQAALSDRLLPGWIAWLREQLADVALHIEAGHSDGIMRQLVDGLLDIGVVFEPRQTAGLETELLLEERLILVATPRREGGQAWQHGYVYVDWGSDFALAHSNAWPNLATPGMSFGLADMALSYILEHGGAGYFPLHTVRPLLREGRLARVRRAPEMKRSTYVVYPVVVAEESMQQVALDGLRAIAAREGERKIIAKTDAALA